MIKRASHELYIWTKLVALNWLFLVRFGFFFLNQKLNLKKKNLIRKFSYDKDKNPS